jgi:5'-deoxynucleotidase YfbR-like HD superfamily hydrolase
MVYRIPAMIENLFAKDCIRTVSGQYVNVFEPNPATIVIEDIAHSLSMQCRFGGHLPQFYSVAQHSVYCAYESVKSDPLAALLHDASEAYLLDIPSPIKARLSNYKEIEDRLMLVIAAKFGFEYPLAADIKKVDAELLRYEWEHIMLNSQNPTAYCWEPKTAKERFLETFKILNAHRKA